MNDRPRKPRRSRSGPPGRRQPPPDATGREAELYDRLVADRTPVDVRTTDGRSHRGTVVEFDGDHLTLRSVEAASPEIRIAFRSIRSIEALDPGR